MGSGRGATDRGRPSRVVRARARPIAGRGRARRAADRGPARPHGGRRQGGRHAAVLRHVRGGRDRRARLDDGHRGRRRRPAGDDDGDHGRRPVRHLAAAPAARPGRSRRPARRCACSSRRRRTAHPPGSASRPWPRPPTGSSCPSSTCSCDARAMCWAARSPASGAPCGCSRWPATATSSLQARTAATALVGDDPTLAAPSGARRRRSPRWWTRRAGRVPGEGVTRIIAGAARGRRLAVPRLGHAPHVRSRARGPVLGPGERVGGRGIALAGGGRARPVRRHRRAGPGGPEPRSHAGAILVERARPAARTLAANVAAVGCPGAEVVTRDAAQLAALPAPTPAARLVFADPPYDWPAADLARLLDRLRAADWIAPDAVVVVERPARDPASPFPAGWPEPRRRPYGDTALWYGRRCVAR